ncbi:YueI family protein [Caldibacillus lycopersici]|uniref:YueI family protein n=1 Tax=Perspicuibacillus lycopersici TaxID=1325689 RepID=A0AAE3IWS2_9BACI|nr:YueI family protein [Perspicuibacillus lycopersici]MCU9614324.1 YueI family protein [Perspicuibacillus lycopersici]
MGNGPNLDDYITQGVYGAKELKPDERRRFLGTLRERIVVVLTEVQVYEAAVYKEIEEEMKRHPQTRMYLNGEIPYKILSKYVQIANKRNIPFTIVENKGYDTDIGLVLAYESKAIDKEEIFITMNTVQNESATVENGNKKSTSKGIKGFFKKFLS